MHQDNAGTHGLTWYQMRRVWYKSLFMGLDANSDFHTVRRNILRAAQQYGLDSLKLQVIRNAFDTVSGYLTLSFRQYLPENRTVSLNLDLVKSGRGSFDVTVCDSQGRDSIYECYD